MTWDDAHILCTLSLFCHTKFKVYQQLYERDDFDEEDIFGVYAKDLPVTQIST